VWPFSGSFPLQSMPDLTLRSSPLPLQHLSCRLDECCICTLPCFCCLRVATPGAYPLPSLSFLNYKLAGIIDGTASYTRLWCFVGCVCWMCLSDSIWYKIRNTRPTMNTKPCTNLSYSSGASALLVSLLSCSLCILVYFL
jgi:hypothetical protein